MLYRSRFAGRLDCRSDFEHCLCGAIAGALPAYTAGCDSESAEGQPGCAGCPNPRGRGARNADAAPVSRVASTREYANLREFSESQHARLWNFAARHAGGRGALSNYDFRVYAQQNVVDLQSYRQYKASELALDAGKLDYKDARDLIVRSIAALYLDAQSAAARAHAAQSRVTDAEALYKLADDKHSAGTATGVDVLRAQVQLANERQALLVDENLYKQSLLSLARNLGMSPGTPLELAQPLEFQPLTEPQIQTLVSAALLARADYLSLARQRESLVEQQRANRARSYPKLSINGNFGGIGRSIGGVQPTGLIQGQIDFTIFDRDRKGEAQELAARVQRIDDQIADMRRGIEEELRAALLNLDSAAEQVSVASEGQKLAQRELEMTQDRFQAGTANNVEVVTAQDEFARAEENYIVAVTNHVDAKFALARAMGDTEKHIVQFMGNP